MKRFLASGLALVFAVLVVATFARTPAAQTGAQVLKACEADEQEIEASALPDVVEPAECPVGERRIVDGLVASVVRPPARLSTRRCSRPRARKSLGYSTCRTAPSS